jgi:hypothetical protein
MTILFRDSFSLLVAGALAIIDISPCLRTERESSYVVPLPPLLSLETQLEPRL